MEITDYNDKQAVLENIPQTSNPPEKQSVTDVTDPDDANTRDKPGTADNIENNSKNINIISNSFNNKSNTLSAVTLRSSTNSPSSSSRCVISVIPLRDNSLDDLPILSCLFCSSYKTRIRFDMDLHLYEKHKQNLIHDLPVSVSVKNASMDNRIKYALQLIEQGKIILSNDPNDDGQLIRCSDRGCE